MSNDQLMRYRAEALGGQSPRQRGQEKTRLALDWVYRWGWSTPSTIDLIGGSNRRGLAARLVRVGLLRETRSESGGAVRGVPAKILTLTEVGQSEIERLRDELLPYDRDPYRIRQDQLRHYQIAQSATAQSLRDGKIAGFQTEQEIAEASASGVKQPDVVWLLPGGQRIGVEIELTAKWGRDLDQFIRASLIALSQQKNQQRPRFDLIAIVTDSPAILRRYRSALEPGATFKLWQKDQRNHWQATGPANVPESARGKILWKLIED